MGQCGFSSGFSNRFSLSYISDRYHSVEFRSFVSKDVCLPNMRANFPKEV